MRIALDTNILIYLEGLSKLPSDDPKIDLAQDLIGKLMGTATLIVPTQVLGEYYNVASRLGQPRETCRTSIQLMQQQFDIVGTTEGTFTQALNLAVDHKLQFWDALIVNAAADAGCTMLLSEDMQSGFEWRGVRVVNPFADQPDRKLARLLA